MLSRMDSHLGLVIFVIALQLMGFKEILQIRHNIIKMERMGPTFYLLVDLYMFFCMDYFMIGVILFSRFPSFFLSRPYLTPLLTHHSLISFLLIIFGTYQSPPSINPSISRSLSVYLSIVIYLSFFIAGCWSISVAILCNLYCFHVSM